MLARASFFFRRKSHACSESAWSDFQFADPARFNQALKVNPSKMPRFLPKKCWSTVHYIFCYLTICSLINPVPFCVIIFCMREMHVYSCHICINIYCNDFVLKTPKKNGTLKFISNLTWSKSPLLLLNILLFYIKMITTFDTV